MKNILITGLVIGLLSGAWLLVLYLIGYETFFVDVLTIFTSGKPLKNTWLSILTAAFIPVIGLYFGLKSYKHRLKDGRLRFAEGILASLKMLIIGGLIAMAFAVLYIHYVSKTTMSEFAETGVVALLLGLAVALVVSFILTTSGVKSPRN